MALIFLFPPLITPVVILRDAAGLVVRERSGFGQFVGQQQAGL